MLLFIQTQKNNVKECGNHCVFQERVHSLWWMGINTMGLRSIKTTQMCSSGDHVQTNNGCLPTDALCLHSAGCLHGCAPSS